MEEVWFEELVLLEEFEVSVKLKEFGATEGELLGVGEVEGVGVGVGVGLTGIKLKFLFLPWLKPKKRSIKSSVSLLNLLISFMISKAKFGTCLGRVKVRYNDENS